MEVGWCADTAPSRAVGGHLWRSRPMGRQSRHVVFAVFVAAGATMTAAFDADGHDAQGQTSASAMDQQAVKQVKRLLGGQDASDVAAWGHQVDDTFPGMERLHFQVHDDAAKPFCGDSAARVAKCEDSICLLAAIKHFYGKVLQREGRKMDFPSIDYSKVSKGMKFSDADSIKMLINLLGDMHQPLHLGHAGDDMGRKVRLRFRGKEVNLYDMWDKIISETVRNEESNFWLGGWTHVRAVQREFERDKESWKAEGAFKMFDKWATESYEFGCKTAYIHPSNGKKLAGPGAEAGPFDISESDYQQWKQLWLKQVLIAGERTGVVLNDILDASSASKLAEGAGVKTDADKAQDEEKKEWAKEREARRKAERRYTGGHFTINPGVALTNLGIACVVVPLFLLVANYGMNPARWKEFIRSLTEAADSNGGGGAAAARNAKRAQ